MKEKTAKILALSWIIAVIILIILVLSTWLGAENNQEVTVDECISALRENNILLEEAEERINGLVAENNNLKQKLKETEEVGEEMAEALRQTNKDLEEAKEKINYFIEREEFLLEEIDRNTELINELLSTLNQAENLMGPTNLGIGVGLLTDFYSAKIFMSYNIIYGFNFMFGGGYVYDNSFFYDENDMMPEWFRRTHMMLGVSYVF